MEYNTSRNRLILPEYGRNVQMMVEYVMEIEDERERNRLAQGIIAVMGNMHPHLRDINDFKHKLWDHLFIMADFNIDIASPYPIPTAESISEKPGNVDYNTNHIRYKFFGKIVEKLVQRAVEMPEGEERYAMIKVIISHLKKSYLMWNKESPEDRIIHDALKELSNGKIDIEGRHFVEDNRNYSNPNPPAWNRQRRHTNNRR